MDLIKDTNEWREVYNKDFYQLFLIWGNKDDGVIPHPVMKYLDIDFVRECKTFQAVLSVIYRFKGIRDIKDSELKNKIVEFLEITEIGENTYPDLGEIDINLIDQYGRRGLVTFNEEISDDELLAYVKDCLSNSDFKEDEYSPLDICELEIYEDEEEGDEESEEEGDEDLEGWADFALTDGIWEETEKEDVISFLERNYPDIELHKTVDGTVFGGRYGQDSLEFRKDHLIIFRGNHSLKYSDIKSGKDIKKFIDKYLPY